MIVPRSKSRSKGADVAQYSSDDLQKLGDLIADPELRKAFWLDPDATLDQQGVNKGAVPNELLDTLRDLSFDELRFLGRFRGTLLRAVEAGVDPKVALRMV